MSFEALNTQTHYRGVIAQVKGRKRGQGQGRGDDTSERDTLVKTGAVQTVGIAREETNSLPPVEAPAALKRASIFEPGPKPTKPQTDATPTQTAEKAIRSQPALLPRRKGYLEEVLKRLNDEDMDDSPDSSSSSDESGSVTTVISVTTATDEFQSEILKEVAEDSLDTVERRPRTLVKTQSACLDSFADFLTKREKARAQEVVEKDFEIFPSAPVARVKPVAPVVPVIAVVPPVDQARAIEDSDASSTDSILRMLEEKNWTASEALRAPAQVHPRAEVIRAEVAYVPSKWESPDNIKGRLARFGRRVARAMTCASSAQQED